MVWYLYLSETPVSHLDTVLPETFNISANCSCVMPFSLRSFFKKFPIFTWSTSTPPFIIKYRICYLQITRHKARNVVFSLIDTVVYAFFIFSIIQTGIEISYIQRDLITVIFYYQISLKPLKTLSLSQVSFPLLFPLYYIVP